MTASVEDLTTGNWKVRRPLVLAILAFCGLQLAYLTIWGEAASALAQTMAIGAYGLAGSTAGSYLFAATWDTKNLILGSRAPMQTSPMVDQFGRPIAAATYGYQGGYAQQGTVVQPVMPEPPLDDRPR